MTAARPILIEILPLAGRFRWLNRRLEEMADVAMERFDTLGGESRTEKVEHLTIRTTISIDKSMNQQSRRLTCFHPISMSRSI